jgi:hypothetical protein
MLHHVLRHVVVRASDAQPGKGMIPVPLTKGVLNDAVQDGQKSFDVARHHAFPQAFIVSPLQRSFEDREHIHVQRLEHPCHPARHRERLQVRCMDEPEHVSIEMYKGTVEHEDYDRVRAMESLHVRDHAYDVHHDWRGVPGRTFAYEEHIVR